MVSENDTTVQVQVNPVPMSAEDRTHTFRGSAALVYGRERIEPVYGKKRGSMMVRVLDINYAKRTLRCVGMQDEMGSGPFENVPILSNIYTQMEGVNWLPIFEKPSADFDASNAKVEGIKDAVAIIDFIGGNIQSPVCIGFLAPGPNQLSFSEPGLRIERHNSDIYERWTSKGVYELAFPDGTYMKIAPMSEGPQLTNIAAQNDIDKGTYPWTIIPQSEPNLFVISHVSGASMIISGLGTMTLQDATGGMFKLANNAGSILTSGQFTVTSGSNNTAIDGIIITVLEKRVTELEKQVVALWAAIGGKSDVGHGHG